MRWLYGNLCDVTDAGRDARGDDNTGDAMGCRVIGNAGNMRQKFSAPNMLRHDGQQIGAALVCCVLVIDAAVYAVLIRGINHLYNMREIIFPPAANVERWRLINKIGSRKLTGIDLHVTAFQGCKTVFQKDL